MTAKSSEPRRYLALFLPLLSADRWLRDNRGGDALAPRVFVEKVRGAMRIAAANEVALGLGIDPGLTLADARARVPDLANMGYDPQNDDRLLEEIADDCDRFTPAVALDPPAGLIFDITGCVHFWESEAELTRAVAARLSAHGFTVKLALGATPDQARALARFGRELLCVPRAVASWRVEEGRSSYLAPPLQGRGWGGAAASSLQPEGHRSPTPNPFPEGEGLSQLPVAALGLDPDHTLALRRAGLTTIGHLARRPRGPFAARFGMAAVAKLARVLGEEDVRIVARRPLPALFFVRRFAEPVAHSDFVLAGVAGLAGEAETALRERGEGGRRFGVSLYRSDGDVRRLAISTGAPARDPKLLDRLFRERIDSLSDPLDPGFGYDAIRLDVADTQPLGPVQIATGGHAETREDATALIDRLGVRLGQGRVRRFAPGNSHIPEQAGLTVAASAPPLPFAWPQAEPGEPPLRPLTMFDPPHRIEVTAEVPDGPPKHFRWRRRLYRVARAEGPERIASEWWRRKRGHEPGQGGLTRDYFRVEDESGRRFWLFRHGLYGGEKQHPDWYLHGCFA